VQQDAANPKYKQSQQKLYSLHYLDISKLVDYKHSKGEGYMNLKVRKFLQKDYRANVLKQTIRRTFRKLGLTWMKVKP
jgi:hypothetical protein